MIDFDPSEVIDKSEMVEFAKIWDPVPIHIDEAVGTRVLGGLTAPGIFVLAVKQRLLHQLSRFPAVIASLEYDKVRFHEPMRPDDTVALVIDWTEKRLSKSREDRGIAVHRLSLVNQRDEVIMSHLDTILIRRRPTEATH